MTSIELTEQHRAKLLEMCQSLFPHHPHDGDYNFWSVSKHYVIYHEYNKVAQWSEAVLSIHWFEFVFCYLVSAIQNNMADEDVWSEMPPYVGNAYRWEKGDVWTMWSRFMFHYPKDLHTDKPHPIDYLYEEFKKLPKLSHVKTLDDIVKVAVKNIEHGKESANFWQGNH